MFVAALAGTSSSDPDTLNLVDLDQHGCKSFSLSSFSSFCLHAFLSVQLADDSRPAYLLVIEHDVSLSRADEAIGSNFLFNETIWNATLAHFPDPLITTSQMAAARADRVATAGAANPVLAFGAGSVGTSLVESSLLMLTFSNGSTDGGASRQQMDTFFREERLPFDEGFEKPAVRITAERVTLMGQQITFVTKPVKASASAPVTSGSGRHVPVDLLMYSLCAAGFVWSYFNFYL